MKITTPEQYLARQARALRAQGTTGTRKVRMSRRRRVSLTMKSDYRKAHRANKVTENQANGVTPFQPNLLHPVVGRLPLRWLEETFARGSQVS
jgi:hypothetical protein